MGHHDIWVDRAEAMADPTPATLGRMLGYQTPWHMREWWQRLRDGPAYSLLLATRRHGKSRTMAVLLPLHTLLTNPDSKIMLVGETVGTVEKWVREITLHMEAQDSVVSHLRPERPGKWTNTEVIIERPGISGDPSIRAVGVGGSMLGSGADLILCDDVVSQENCSTQARRDGLMEWFLNVLIPMKTRRGRVVVIGTPWHDDDLYAHLAASGQWHTLRYPAEGDYPGGTLWPEEYPLSRLQEIRQQIGSVAYARQFMLDLSKVEGGMVSPSWFRYYSRLPEGRGKWIIAVDPSIGRTERADYTGIVAGGALFPGDPRVYVHDMDMGRWEAQARIASITRMYERYPDAHIVIEETAMSMDFIGMLRRETSLPVKTVSPGGKDKVSRLNVHLPAMERGDIVFNETLRGSALVGQLIEFPNGSYDDLVDAFVYMVGALRQPVSGGIAIGRLEPVRVRVPMTGAGVPRMLDRRGL